MQNLPVFGRIRFYDNPIFFVVCSIFTWRTILISGIALLSGFLISFVVLMLYRRQAHQESAFLRQQILGLQQQVTELQQSSQVRSPSLNGSPPKPASCPAVTCPFVSASSQPCLEKEQYHCIDLRKPTPADCPVCKEQCPKLTCSKCATPICPPLQNPVVKQSLQKPKSPHEIKVQTFLDPVLDAQPPRSPADINKIRTFLEQVRGGPKQPPGGVPGIEKLLIRPEKR